MADDLGYGELGSFGQKLIQTPNIDQLSREGMRFTQYYAGAPLCNPSRYALLVGQHAGTTGVITNGRNELPEGAITIGHVMRAAGYKTGIIGKWALGRPGSVGGPLEQGFDYFFGYENQSDAHNYYPETLTENNSQVTLPGNRESAQHRNASHKVTYAPDVLLERTLSFMARNRHNPFYLQLDYTLPHVNNELQKYSGNGFEHPGENRYAMAGWKDTESSYAELVSILDDYVGEIMAALDSLALNENTIVIFTSDNGPTGVRTLDGLLRFGATGKFKGMKGGLYEGGIRVPMVAWWPGVIQSDSTYGVATTFWDVMPTLTELVDSPLDTETDGISFAKALTNDLTASPERLLYWQLKDRVAARHGSWKWMRVNMGQPNQRDFLFNITLDPGESNNLAKQEPQKLKELQDMASSYIHSI